MRIESHGPKGSGGLGCGVCVVVSLIVVTEPGVWIVQDESSNSAYIRSTFTDRVVDSGPVPSGSVCAMCSMSAHHPCRNSTRQLEDYTCRWS